MTSFPSGAGKWQVSGGHGDMPAWRKDGREIYLVSASELQAIEVSSVANQFTFGPPRTITRLGNAIAAGRVFDVMPDGSRFVAPIVPTDTASPIQLLLNWPADLQAKK